MISRNFEEDHGMNISVKFIKIRLAVSEKMFKENLTHGRTHARRTTGHDISPLAYGQWS